MNIQVARCDNDLRECFKAFSELRPHLDEAAFIAQVKRQQQNHGYQLVYIRDGSQVVAAAGFRVAEFLAWGKTFYLDDLVTLASQRKQGYGGALLDWLLQEADRLACQQFHLDSGTHRHEAHRLYMSRKLQINSYHFSKALK